MYKNWKHSTSLAQYQQLRFSCTAIDIRNTAHVAGMDGYQEHIKASYASLENAWAALSSLFAEEGYIMNVLHTGKVENMLLLSQPRTKNLPLRTVSWLRIVRKITFGRYGT